MDLHHQSPQSIEQVREEIERCNFHLHTLFDIGKDIFGIMDVELILKNSLLFTLGNFGVIEGFIGIFDAVSKKAKQFVSEGYQHSDIQALRKSAEKTLLQKNLTDSAAINAECGGHQLLPSSVNCILPFKIDLETDQFMTLLFMVIEAHSGRLTWVRAGHDPIIVYSPARINSAN